MNSGFNRATTCLIALAVLLSCQSSQNSGALAADPPDWSDQEILNLDSCQGRLLPLGGKAGKQTMAGLDKEIKLHPANLNALLKRAAANLDGGDIKAAATDYQQVINLEPKLALGYVGLSRTLKNQGKYYDAQEELKKALTVATPPEAAGIVWESGDMYSGLRQREKALAQFNKALTMPPPNKYFLPHMYFERGVQYAETSRYAIALKDFDKALDLAPGWIDPLRMRARMYFFLGKLPDSLTDYSRAIAKEEAHFDRLGILGTHLEELYQERAKLYQQMHRQDLAQRDLKSLENLKKEGMSEMLFQGK